MTQLPLLLDAEIDAALEKIAASTRRSKADLVNEAVTAFVRREAQWNDMVRAVSLTAQREGEAQEAEAA
ncbi:MAG: CopG family ribbon-helix-helix protein [Hyphomonadaceae bacterium]